MHHADAASLAIPSRRCESTHPLPPNMLAQKPCPKRTRATCSAPSTIPTDQPAPALGPTSSFESSPAPRLSIRSNARAARSFASSAARAARVRSATDGDEYCPREGDASSLARCAIASARSRLLIELLPPSASSTAARASRALTPRPSPPSRSAATSGSDSNAATICSQPALARFAAAHAIRPPRHARHGATQSATDPPAASG